MYVRAIALAIPLALGIAGCKTAGSQASETATSEPTRSQDQATASSSQPQQGEAPPIMGAPPSTSGTVKGHQEDETVSGKLSSVSSQEIQIQSDLGEQRTLQVVPQTVITMEGRDVGVSELQEGQEVRASFSDQEGRPTAVKIEIRPSTGMGTGDTGQSGTGMPSDMGMGTDTGTGSGTDSGSDTDTGTGSGSDAGTGTGTGSDPSPSPHSYPPGHPH